MPAGRGRTSASTTRARSGACSSIRAIRMSSSWRRSVTRTAPTPIAACTARATAARPGRRCCSRATTSAPSTLRSIRPHLRRSTRRSGTRAVRRGAFTRRRTARAAALYKSTDGGTTWQALTSGLPTDGLGHIGVAVAPSNANRVYAIVDAKEGGLFRSDDAGATWTKVSADSRIWGRGWYFGKVVVDPKNQDLVYVSNTGVYRSRDGGRTFGEPFKGSPGGDDYHQLWIDPADGNRMILGGDQGAVISVDGLARAPDVELVAESADGAGLSHRRRQRVSVLGDRRAAGQRRRPRPQPRQVREHHDARLGAGLRGRRERLHRARSARSRHPVRRHGDALQHGNWEERQHVAGSGPADAAAPHVDAAAGLLAGRSARAVFQRSVPVQDDRRRAALGPHQRGHDARESGRPVQPRCRNGRRRARRRAARRDLHDLAIGRAVDAPLDRHRRWLHPCDAG